MHFRLLAALCLFLFASLQAQSGAWPREKGRSFVSGSAILSPNSFAAWNGLYYERGLSPRLTLGFDGDQRYGTGDNWQAVAFLRWDLTPGASFKRAVGLGLGQRGRKGGAEFVVRPTYAIGRGFTSRLGPGWAEAELQLIYGPSTGWTAMKLDTTLGLKATDRRMWILQLQASDYPGTGPSLRIVPSFVQRMGRGISLELALTTEVNDLSGAEIRVGAWFEF